MSPEEVGKYITEVMRRNLARYAGNPELMLKENPHRDFAYPERRRAKPVPQEKPKQVAVFPHLGGEPHIQIPGGLNAEERARAISAAEHVKADPQGFVDRYRGEFGNEFNADNASELLPEYNESSEARTRFHRAVHPVTRWIRDEAFRQALAEPPSETPNVILTAGGSGSGKSTSITPPPKGVLVYDSTLSVYEGAKQTIEQVLASGRRARVRYLYRDIGEAYDNGVLKRAMHEGKGRTVSLVSQVRSHQGARDTVLQLIEEYRDDSRVEIELLENAGPGTLAPLPIERLQAQNYTGSNEQLNAILENAFRETRISRSVYDVSRGRRLTK
jgi:hypothetical protein